MIEFFSQLRKHRLTIIAIVVSVLLLCGITYGLPLHLIGDEESLIGGALTMLATKTFIPALHPAAFNLLYYPVVIPYLIIAASTPVILVQWLLHGFSISATQTYLLFHLDGIWIASRLLSVIATLLLLQVVYKLASRLFSRRAAFFSVALLATSFFTVSLGHWVRHWSFATLIAYATFYAIVVYIEKKNSKTIVPAILAAIGVGVSYVVLFAHLISGIYVLTRRKMLGRNFWKFVLWNIVVFLITASALLALYYQEFFNDYVHEDATVQISKSFAGLLATIVYGLHSLALQETVLFLAAIAGLVFVRKYLKQHAFIFSALISYLSFLYFFLHIETRYVYFLLPGLAMVGGNFFDWFVGRSRKVGFIIFSLAIAVSFLIVAQYDYLLSVPDTRILALQWIQGHKNQELIIDSPTIIAPRTQQSLVREEQYAQIRQQERYAVQHDTTPINEADKVHYTNLHFWHDQNNQPALENYLQQYHPQYAIIEYWDPQELSIYDQQLISKSILRTRLKQSNVLQQPIDINGNFFEPSLFLLLLQRAGPTIDIYELTSQAAAAGL